MNARTDDSAALFVEALTRNKDSAPTITACFHCGLDVLPDSNFTVEIDQHAERMCCVGCMSVAQTIIGAGMADFYRHRVGYSEKLDPRSLPQPAVATTEPVKRAIRHAAAAPAELHLYLTGLRCSACVWLAERTLGGLDGMSRVAVNLTTQSARMHVDLGRISADDIVAA